jgi:phosphatidylethanolamine-binding protein (PEBP) family uncharacterized protein
MEKIVLRRLSLLRNLLPLTVTSPAFADSGAIPARYTADGEGLSPPLRWHQDSQAAGYGLLMEDADAPAGHPLVHAMVVGLSGSTHSLPEGALSSPHHSGASVDPGIHAAFKQAWLPPHPPRDGAHRYAFQVFALRFQLRFAKPPGRNDFIEMVLEFAFAGGCIMGTYQRAAQSSSARRKTRG